VSTAFTASKLSLPRPTTPTPAAGKLPHPSSSLGCDLLTYSLSAAAVGGIERMEIQARKFYSQRNMYLCGFTLFLSLILNRTYTMILEVLRLELENRQMKGTDGPKDAKLNEASSIGEVGRLKKELAAKDRDIETLKKQAQGLSTEYNRLGDQVSGTSDATPKKDR
jgi:B-cell receptor-associated protein 31